MAAPVRCVAVLALATLLAGVAHAAPPLADPTLPPQIVRSDDATAAAPAKPQLQFILRGPGDARSALLAGRWMRAGETITFNGAQYRIEQVTESSVLLARGDVREVLDLSPAAAQAVRCLRLNYDNGC